MRVPPLNRSSLAVLALSGALVAGSPAAAGAQSNNANASSGGAGLRAMRFRSTPSHPMVRGWKARIIRGVAYAPVMAPIQVKRAIWAGNRIRLKPYIYGGGHGSFVSAGYDCSGSVSYVLHGAGLLSSPLDSSDFMSWGLRGWGRWITVFTNPGHAFVEIAGIRFDTSAEGDPHPAPGSGPRWRPLLQNTGGFEARHLAGL